MVGAAAKFWPDLLGRVFTETDTDDEARDQCGYHKRLFLR